MPLVLWASLSLIRLHASAAAAAAAEAEQTKKQGTTKWKDGLTPVPAIHLHFLLQPYHWQHRHSASGTVSTCTTYRRLSFLPALYLSPS